MDAGGSESLKHDGAKVVARKQPRIPTREELESKLLWPTMAEASGHVAVRADDEAAQATVNLISVGNMVYMRVVMAGLDQTKVMASLTSEDEQYGL